MSAQGRPGDETSGGSAGGAGSELAAAAGADGGGSRRPAGAGAGSRPRPRRRRSAASRAWALRLGALAVLGSAGAWAWSSLHNAQLREAGLALYEGRLPADAVNPSAGAEAFSARLAGHVEPLPAEAWRCINCHGLGGSEPPRAAGDATETPVAGVAAVAASGAIRLPAPARAYAAALNRASLLEPRSRRGGPPSIFDQAGLCRLLRTGVDPAHVLISTTMPRYTLSDLQCRQLMAYLVSL